MDPRWMLIVVVILMASQTASGVSVGICGQPWKSVYVHDASGWHVQGSLLTLHKHVESAYLAKVRYSTADNAFVVPLDEFHVRGPHVCGTHSWILSENGTHFEQDTEWSPVVVCTSGEVYQSNYSANLWSRDVTSQPIAVEGEIKWFTKPTSCNEHPVYSHYFDGTQLSGSKSKLVQFAKTSGLKISMRDRGYSIATQNANVYGDELVTAQSLNHLSLKHSPTGLKPNDQPFYQWHAVWTSAGRRDISRWNVNSTTSHGHENDQVALDWFGDDCWRKVMATDGSGHVTYGSLEELMLMIRLGHEVRLHVDGLTLKATSLQIVDGKVIALTTDEFARRGSYPRLDAPFFNTNARVVYRLVHSSGKMSTYMFMIEDYSLSEKTDSREPIDWLVDSRPWVKIHETNSTDAASKIGQSLNDTISDGASIRICLERDSTPGQMMFLQTDSVRRDSVTDDIVGQSIRNIVTRQNPNAGDEWFIPSPVSQLSLLVSAKGSVSAQTRRLATRATHHDDVMSLTAVKTTWFANR